MAEPYLGEVKMVSFNFAPRGWALCAGQTLPINQNQALFSLLGTTFGGDGRTSFKLPDLRGRTPVHTGDYQGNGVAAGTELAALTINNLPAHNHRVVASSQPADKTAAKLGTDMFANTNGTLVYGSANNLVSFQSNAITDTGAGNQTTHENVQPSIVTNFIIALQGTFPSRS